MKGDIDRLFCLWQLILWAAGLMAANVLPRYWQFLAIGINQYLDILAKENPGQASLVEERPIYYP
jgi:hypothetical protein